MFLCTNTSIDIVVGNNLIHTNYCSNIFLLFDYYRLYECLRVQLLCCSVLVSGVVSSIRGKKVGFSIHLGLRQIYMY